MVRGASPDRVGQRGHAARQVLPEIRGTQASPAMAHGERCRSAHQPPGEGRPDRAAEAQRRPGQRRIRMGIGRDIGGHEPGHHAGERRHQHAPLRARGRGRRRRRMARGPRRALDPMARWAWLHQEVACRGVIMRCRYPKPRRAARWHDRRAPGLRTAAAPPGTARARGPPPHAWLASPLPHSRRAPRRWSRPALRGCGTRHPAAAAPPCPN